MSHNYKNVDDILASLDSMSGTPIPLEALVPPYSVMQIIDITMTSLVGRSVYFGQYSAPGAIAGLLVRYEGTEWQGAFVTDGKWLPINTNSYEMAIDLYMNHHIDGTIPVIKNGLRTISLQLPPSPDLMKQWIEQWGIRSL